MRAGPQIQRLDWVVFFLSRNMSKKTASDDPAMTMRILTRPEVVYVIKLEEKRIIANVKF